jgi:3-methyladenine DNA glycosylase AlkD
MIDSCQVDDGKVLSAADVCSCRIPLPDIEVIGMTANEIVAELRSLGSDGYKHTLRNHGIPEPFYGVKIEDLQKIRKRVKQDYRLALELYDTGIYDAKYLAGLIADDHKMTKDDLRHWLDNANCAMLGVYTVAWVASESPHGRELAMEWIESKDENVAAAGWATLASLVSIKDDSDLDMSEVKQLLEQIEKSIHGQPNNVKSLMNGFLIAVGTYVKPLSEDAMRTAMKIGKVSVDKGETECKVPFAPDYIEKARQRGTVGKKRKSAKC